MGKRLTNEVNSDMIKKAFYHLILSEGSSKRKEVTDVPIHSMGF